MFAIATYAFNIYSPYNAANYHFFFIFQVLESTLVMYVGISIAAFSYAFVTPLKYSTNCTMHIFYFFTLHHV